MPKQTALPETGAPTSPNPVPVSATTIQIPRRTHRKSRTGCQRCKARKIKCDERHPACLNCISHGVECPYLSKPSVSSQTSPLPPTPTPTPSTPTPITPRVPSPVHDDPLPMLELELLHNFTTETYATLAIDPDVSSFWRLSVVEIGLQCDYIMRAVLAISALHLAYHRPDRRDYYTAQGIILHQRAARSAMRFINPDEIGRMDLDGAARLFLFSMLTIYFALASPRRSLADGSFFIGEVDGFPDWTFLLNGAKSLSNLLGTEGKSTILAPFLAYGGQRWHATRSRLPVPTLEEVDTLRRRIAERVEDGALLATYRHALDELELDLLARMDEGTPRDVLGAMLWLWTVSDSLVPLLRAMPGDEESGPKQEAVAIFAHFSIILKHHESESHWWLQGWADHLLARAYEILDHDHRPWIEWPMKEVGWMPPG